MGFLRRRGEAEGEGGRPVSKFGRGEGGCGRPASKFSNQAASGLHCIVLAEAILLFSTVWWALRARWVGVLAGCETGHLR